MRILFRLELSEDGFRNLIQRYNLVHRTTPNGLLRHSIDDTTGLILRNGASTSIAHFKKSLGPIPAHSRHDDPDAVGACVLGH